MSLEAEHLLSKVRSVRNVSERGDLVKKAVRVMTPAEKSMKQEELARINEQLSPSNQNSLPGHTVLDADAVRHMAGYRKFLEKDLAENAAPEQISGESKDALYARQKFLEEQFVPGMDTHEVMRRNPPGAVGKYVKWQKEQTDNVLEWKNIRRMLNPDDDTDDLANIETLRPSGFVQGGASRFDVDAYTKGHFAMSQAAKQNWPEGMNEIAENSPYARKLKEEMEGLRAELAALKAQPKEVAAPVKRERSAKQIANDQKMRERAIAKRVTPAE